MKELGAKIRENGTEVTEGVFIQGQKITVMDKQGIVKTWDFSHGGYLNVSECVVMCIIAAQKGSDKLRETIQIANQIKQVSDKK